MCSSVCWGEGISRGTDWDLTRRDSLHQLLSFQPANIFVQKNYTLKLIDFGCARKVSDWKNGEVGAPVGNAEFTGKLVYQQIVAVTLLHPKCLVSFPKNAIATNDKITNKRLSCAKELAEVSQSIMLQERDALWSNCKRTQSGESVFFLRKKLM